MNTRAALRQAIERLTAVQVPSATTTAEVLLLHVLNHDRTFLYAHPETELTLEQERAYRHLVSERAAGKPTQYLTGEQEFWGLSFRVTPGVFIPRPETEHVVEVALRVVRERITPDRAGMARDRQAMARDRERRVRIVDVGTGTGCIALALASELPEAEIIGVDIDPNALAVARENAARLRLAHRVRFEQSDLLRIFLGAERQGSREAEEAKETDEAHEAREHGLALFTPSAAEGSEVEGSPVAGRRLAPSGVEGSRFDLIVSNPPYVSEAAAEQLPREVREHEPPTALYAPDEGLGLTRRLIKQAAQLLVPARVTVHESRVTPSQPTLGGWLVLELGYQMAGRVRALLGEAWTNIEVTDDLRGIPRVLAAQKK